MREFRLTPTGIVVAETSARAEAIMGATARRAAMTRTLPVVEDKPSIADLLALFLREEGYRVVLAPHGRAALACLAAERDDLVALLDGMGLARAMHADSARRAIPLILMSAVHRTIEGVAHYAAFLPKPFNLDRLLATVARLLGPDDRT
jgi:DNA-binding response OmpR family regulator